MTNVRGGFAAWTLSLSENGKAALSAAFFVSYPLLSEYQVWVENWPKFSDGIRAEVVWNEGEHFGTVREKLDKFSTFGGFAGKHGFPVLRATGDGTSVSGGRCRSAAELSNTRRFQAKQ
jgi:hypothetical protein